MSRKRCQCGKPTVAGRYCFDCLEQETKNLTMAELVSASHLLTEVKPMTAPSLEVVAGRCSLCRQVHETLVEFLAVTTDEAQLIGNRGASRRVRLCVGCANRIRKGLGLAEIYAPQTRLPHDKLNDLFQQVARLQVHTTASESLKQDILGDLKDLAGGSLEAQEADQTEDVFEEDPVEQKRRLFHVQDRDRPMYVLAEDWQDAVRKWRQFVHEESNDDPPPGMIDPEGISLVAEYDDLLL